MACAARFAVRLAALTDREPAIEVRRHILFSCNRRYQASGNARPYGREEDVEIEIFERLARSCDGLPRTASSISDATRENRLRQTQRL
jgi:hypothetical protein